MKKVMSFLLTLAMIMMVLPTALVSAESVSVGLTYVDSTPCLATSGGKTHDKLYPLDGDFATSFKSASVVGGFYTVALDGEYELTTMKIYHDYGRDTIGGSNHWYARLNKVYVSNDGVDFTEVTGVSITATGWIQNSAETNYEQLVRVDYTFPEGTKAKYIKVTNDLETATEFRLSEMFVYGEKVVTIPKLSSLTVSGATLSPAFDPEITDYEVIFAGEITMPTFLPTVAEGLTVTSEGPDANYVFKINVSDGSTTNTYTFKAVSTTVATNLKLSYYDSSTLKGDGNLGVDGDFSTECSVSAKEGNYYTIKLGNGEVEYEITELKIYQNSTNNAAYPDRYRSIYVSSDGVSYTPVTDISLTSTSSWMSAAERTADGIPTTAGAVKRHTIAFPEGTRAKYVKIANALSSNNEMRIVEARVVGKVYVEVPKLSSLTVSGATLSPAFDPEITDYEVIFAGEITMPTFNPTAAEGLTVTSEGPDANYVFKINVSDGITTNTYNFKAVSTTVATNLALTYHESSGLRDEKASNAPFDGDLETECRVVSKEGNYYTVKLGNGNSLYELTEMKLFQRSGGNRKARYSKVYVSEDGTDFTAVTCEPTEANWVYDDEISTTVNAVRCLYTFPEGTKAKYIKIGNELTSDNEMVIAELRVKGKVYVEKPKLDSVTVTGATLSPEFDPDVTYYTLKYDGEITVPNFSYEAAEGLTVTPSGPNAKNEFTITVTDGLGVTTYTVKAVSKIVDNDLTLKCIGHIKGSTTTDASLAFDGDFTTRFEAKSINPMSNAFFEIELDDVYELSTMKLYQDTGHADKIFTAFYDKVEISDDGITYTDISDTVKITSEGWMFNNPETANVAMVRVDYKFTGGTKAKYIKIGNYYPENTVRDFRISELNIYGFIPSPKVYTVTPSKGYLSPEYDFRTTEYTLFAGELKTAIPTLSATVAEGYSAVITQPTESNNYTGKIEFIKDGSEEVLKTYTITLEASPVISVDTSGLSFITGSGYLSVYSDLTLYDEDAVLFLVKYNDDGSLSEIKIAESKDKIDDKIQTGKIYVTYSDLENIKAMLFNGNLVPVCEPVTYANFIQ